jgi:hypothetical protein
MGCDFMGCGVGEGGRRSGVGLDSWLVGPVEVSDA